MNLRELRQVAKKPMLLVLGLIANTAAPVLFAFAVMTALKMWLRDEEARVALVGWR